MTAKRSTQRTIEPPRFWLRSPAAQVRAAAGGRPATRIGCAELVRRAGLRCRAGQVPDAVAGAAEPPAQPRAAAEVPTPGAPARPPQSGCFRPPGWVAAAGEAATAQVPADRLSAASRQPLARRRWWGSSRSSVRSRSARRFGGYLDCARQTRSPSSVPLSRSRAGVSWGRPPPASIVHVTRSTSPQGPDRWCQEDLRAPDHGQICHRHPRQWHVSIVVLQRELREDEA